MLAPNYATRQQGLATRPVETGLYRTIIIIITHLLHENKSEVLTIEIEMADMQMEQARSYKLIQGLVPRAG